MHEISPLRYSIEHACEGSKRGVSPPERSPLAPAAELTAYLALLPLIACLLGMGFLPMYAQRDLAQQIAVGYGAVVLAAAGAVHFGLAVGQRLHGDARTMAGAALPALCAAASVVLGGQHGLALLVVAGGLFWLYEHRVLGPQLPAAYLRLRRNLTLAGCILLAITMILSDYVGLV